MIWGFSMHEVSMKILGLMSVCCGVSGVASLSKGSMNVVEWELLSFNSTSVVFTLIFDWISLMFLCFVFLISSSVLFYSGSYMGQDKSFNRFMYIVLAFVFSMSMMVLSPNLISILLGWDGLGLVSYALVIFYQNEKSANAGMLTILSNRVGDVAILLGIGFMSSMGSWDFFLYSSYMDSGWEVLKILLALAAMTKSAQIPFSAWLPAAMAAPTPVSALVHSSTLVTAGVYLMIRFSPALENSSVQIWLLVVSCLTMFMAGLGANYEYDLKKIIALSTLSQLGVMLSTLALGCADLAFFHLLSHAMFKALLFMCAGVVIHSAMDCQDIRSMGGLVNFMPLTMSFMSVANLALCGFPFLAGFYSKDMILEVAFLSWLNFVVLGLFVLSTGLTVMYTFRLIFYVLSGDFNMSALNNVTDEDSTMSNSMFVLGAGAVLGGASLSWILFPEPFMICLDSLMKSVVLSVSVLGGGLGYFLNVSGVSYSLKSLSNYNLIYLSGSMWFMPLLSSSSNKTLSFKIGGLVQKTSDTGWYEYFGGQGLFYLFSKMFFVLNKSQMNSVKVFMKVFVVSVIVVLFSVVICFYNL